MSSVVWRKKKLATVIVGLFSLKENAPTKNTGENNSISNEKGLGKIKNGPASKQDTEAIPTHRENSSQENHIRTCRVRGNNITWNEIATLSADGFLDEHDAYADQKDI